MSLHTQLRIQPEDFDSGALLHALEADAPQIGAVCCFTGLARDYGDQAGVTGLFLEHYPGMTEKALSDMIQQARQRWPLHQVKIIHRIGLLRAGERIVFVGVSSTHRAAAFAACEFLMDYLKTAAPFWKKEITATDSHWVEQKDVDQARAKRWD